MLLTAGRRALREAARRVDHEHLDRLAGGTVHALDVDRFVAGIDHHRTREAGGAAGDGEGLLSGDGLAGLRILRSHGQHDLRGPVEGMHEHRGAAAGRVDRAVAEQHLELVDVLGLAVVEGAERGEGHRVDRDPELLLAGADQRAVERALGQGHVGDVGRAEERGRCPG